MRRLVLVTLTETLDVRCDRCSKWQQLPDGIQLGNCVEPKLTQDGFEDNGESTIEISLFPENPDDSDREFGAHFWTPPGHGCALFELEES